MPATRIVFYDGLCPLCNAAVRLLLRLDRHGVLHFAPLQGSTAQRLLPGRPTDPDALVYWREGKPLMEASSAILAVLSDLAWPWSWGRVLLWVPKFFRDGVYDFLARRRYVPFGRFEACPVPDKSIAEKFLD